VRVAIELMAVKLACMHMADTALHALAEQWNPATLHFGAAASDRIKQAEEDFHIALALGTGNAALAHYLADINDHIRVVRRLGWPDFSSIEDTYAEHFHICQLILARDQAAAE